ncbi:mitochondrial coenzyme A transporter SLC25A42 [Achroia grisella]|uniref:mitochondrial coenzyme A transporter SLC25A42 n=1 Tax=Achroia grisella TaxID=688607 RepID=UPI0027D28F94|nr:mitochondrial coenzyme A transporter SLC25A42 [Achroia grisella]
MAVGEARIPPLLREEITHTHQESPKPAGASNGHQSLSHGTTVATSLVAGAAAGAIAKTVIAPLDRTKINFQISETPYSWRAAWCFLRQSAAREGLRALWRGNSATMARIVPYAAVQFTAHEQWKRLLGVDSPQAARAHPALLALAGSLAGVTSQSMTYPLDLARARMAVTSADHYRTLRAVFTTVVREEGVRTLYRGYWATVLGVIPYAGVSFYTYDTLKHKYLEHFGREQGALVNVALGGAAGALAQTASYPLDIVRRRLQTARRAHSALAAAAHVRRTEGWRGFFKGLSMNWVKGPIAVGISFATYDAIRTQLRDLAVTLQS